MAGLTSLKIHSYFIKYLPHLLILIIVIFIPIYFFTSVIPISRLISMFYFGFLSIMLLLLWIKYQNNFSSENYAGEMKRGRYYFGILFFVIFSLSLLTIYFRENLYERPTLYFLLIFILIFLVLFEIFTVEMNTMSIVMVLVQIILLNLNILLSQHLLYPTILGIDPWYHQGFTRLITEFSHVPVSQGQYSSMPLYHILLAITQLFTTVDYKLSSIIVAIIIQDICLALVIFWIGKKLFHERIGLIAAFCCLMNMFFLVNQGNLVPFAFCFIYVVFILFLFIHSYRNPNIRISVLMILLMIATLVTHALPAFFLNMLITIILIFFIFFNYKYEGTQIPVSVITVLLFWTLFFVYYIYTDFPFIYILKSQADINLFSVTTPIYNFEHVTRVISNEIGSFFTINRFTYFFFSIIGILYLLNYRRNDFRRLLIFFGVMIGFGIGFSSTITNMDFENFRWIYFASILNSILFALSFFIFYNITKKNYYVKLLLVLLISFIFFNSIVSISIDNNVYTNSKILRYTFTESEMISLNTLYVKWDGVFASDGVVSLPIQYHVDNRPEIFKNYPGFMSLDAELSQMKFENSPNRIILIREAIRAGMPINIRGHYRLNYDPVPLLDNERGIKLYDSGSIYGYSLI